MDPFCLIKAVLSLGCVAMRVPRVQQPLLKALISQPQMLTFNLPFLWRPFTSLSEYTAGQGSCSIKSFGVKSRGQFNGSGGRSA